MTSVPSEPSFCAMCREMEENSDKTAGYVPTCFWSLLHISHSIFKSGFSSRFGHHAQDTVVHRHKHTHISHCCPGVSLLTSHHNSRMLEMSCSSCIILTWMLQTPGGISTAPLCLSSRIKLLNLGRGLAQEQQRTSAGFGSSFCFGDCWLLWIHCLIY